MSKTGSHVKLKDIENKLEALFTRVYGLETLRSENKNNDRGVFAEIIKPNESGNSQEQDVMNILFFQSFLWYLLIF
jgi:hypothetical protein